MKSRESYSWHGKECKLSTSEWTIFYEDMACLSIEYIWLNDWITEKTKKMNWNQTDIRIEHPYF